MDDDLGAVGQDHLDSPLIGAVGADDSNNKSKDPYPEEWLDVRELKKLSLEEVRSFPSSDDDQEGYVPLTKVVVRRLPLSFTVKEYLGKLPEVPSYNYIRRLPPIEDLPSSIDGRTAIVINFDKEHEAFWFKEKYNKKEFLDDQGNLYVSSCVDYSFVQGIAKDPPSDPEMGYLEDTQMYRRFLNVYNNQNQDPQSIKKRRPDEISAPGTEGIKNRSFPVGYLGENKSPVSDFMREQAKIQEQAKRKREKEEFRRKQREEMLKRQQEEEEDSKKRKQKEKADSKSSPPMIWEKLENKQLRESFKLMQAECKRSQERMKKMNYSRKSTDKLATEPRTSNNEQSSNKSLSISLSKSLPDISDLSSSSSSSEESICSVKKSGRISVPQRQPGDFQGSKKPALSKSEKDINEEGKGSKE